MFEHSQYEPWEPPPMSEEELRRIEKEPDYSTEEVLAHLESLSEVKREKDRG